MHSPHPFDSREHGPVGLGTAPAQPAGPQIARFRSRTTRSEPTVAPERTHPKSTEITTRMNTSPRGHVPSRLPCPTRLHDETSLIYPGPSGGDPAKAISASVPSRSVLGSTLHLGRPGDHPDPWGGRGRAQRPAPLYHRLVPKQSESNSRGWENGRTS